MKKIKSFSLFTILFILFFLSLAMPLDALDDTQGGACTKYFYTPSDIIGYFRDASIDESYYLTYDGCVVKALLWYGTIFGRYNVSFEEIKKNLGNIFPEKQVYFGLIPAGFIRYKGSKYYLPGKFTTAYHLEQGGRKNTGIFLNDNPFKNIFGGNYPQPPRFVPGGYFFNPPFEVKWPEGSIASLLHDRMIELDDIHTKYIVTGYCNVPDFSQRFPHTCDYFSSRVIQFTPHAYYGFSKLPEYNP